MNLDVQSYKPKTVPMAHQWRGLEETANSVAAGILFEQGCGKTKVAIDTAAMWWEAGDIDAVLVVAPSGVQRNWFTDEIPKHLPDRAAESSQFHVYKGASASTKWHAKALEGLLKSKRLAWLFISYDSFMTEKGKAYCKRFLTQRKVFYILDESHYIKTPAAKRTKTIVSSGRYAKARRILTGTPATTGPFDLYSQIKFLEPNFWADRRIGTFAAFKQRYGVWLTREEAQRQMGYDPGFDRLIEYKNTEELAELLQSVSTRVTKAEALDLPPKLYSKRYVTLTKEQRRMYDELRNDSLTLIGNQTVTADLAIVRLLRFQQIICGYVKTDENVDEPAVRLPGPNPRLNEFLEIDATTHTQGIVWCRFKADVDLICERLGDQAARYDGSLSEDEAEAQKQRFQAGEAKWFVATQAKGRTGLTLIQAKVAVYYSNSFSLEFRLQCEDRPHRHGQDQPVLNIDLVAEDTVDEHIIKSLRAGRDIAASLTGDELQEWI